MARKPNYDFEKRRKEQERKAKKDSPKYNLCQTKAAKIENSLRNKEGKPPMKPGR